VKKILLFSALFVCVFVSCKKNNSSSGGSYHFTATIDGQAQTFNVSPLAVKVTNSGASLIAIEGFSAASSTTQILSVSWGNTSPNSANFTTGAYSDTATAYYIGGNYNPSTTVAYVSGSGVTAAVGSSLPSGVQRLKITITSVDSTAVKGTFSGDFFFNGDVTQGKKTITNGDFYVPWKK
jgi:hypothetical protein